MRYQGYDSVCSSGWIDLQWFAPRFCASVQWEQNKELLLCLWMTLWPAAEIQLHAVRFWQSYWESLIALGSYAWHGMLELQKMVV